MHQKRRLLRKPHTKNKASANKNLMSRPMKVLNQRANQAQTQRLRTLIRRRKRRREAKVRRVRKPRVKRKQSLFQAIRKSTQLPLPTPLSQLRMLLSQLQLLSKKTKVPIRLLSPIKLLRPTRQLLLTRPLLPMLPFLLTRPLLPRNTPSLMHSWPNMPAQLPQLSTRKSMLKRR